MKQTLLTLTGILAFSLCAHAGDQSLKGTYKERYGRPRFTDQELAERQRDNEDYARNGQIYERLDDLENKIDALQKAIDDLDQ